MSFSRVAKVPDLYFNMLPVITTPNSTIQSLDEDHSLSCFLEWLQGMKSTILHHCPNNEIVLLDKQAPRRPYLLIGPSEPNIYYFAEAPPCHSLLLHASFSRENVMQRSRKLSY